MILGVTPARGGSKGIPKKNIRMLSGKPLIAWTIETAKKSRLLDRYVVSTENREIARVSEEYGAEVINRPKELATDEASTLSVLQHVLKQIDADTVVLLQCTSPVRSEDLIDRCIRKFQDAGVEVLATGYICKLFEWGTYSSRRQNLEGFFHDDGNVYVFKSELLRAGKIWSKNSETVLTQKEETFEIDDEFDFWLNEQILDALLKGTRHLEKEA